jgi:mRNA-degrading endonuclease toxin of MazEF toxin-antitoxin module
MVVPFTRNIDALKFPYSYGVTRTPQNGLSNDSVAQVYQTRCLTYARFIRRIGVLENIHCDRIQILLRDYLNL